MHVYTETIKKLVFYISRAVLIALTSGAVLLVTLYEMELAGWNSVFTGITTPVLPYANHIFAYLGMLALVAVCGLIPTAKQVRQLEVHHRDFTINMEDVLQAYTLMHAADRQGVFHLYNQFDAVRERLHWARKHPSLASLESDILTIAAQMSVTSHNLAETYSDTNVERAQQFIEQRLEETERLETLVGVAQSLEANVRATAQDIDLREATANSQLQRHLEATEAALQKLGYTMTKLPETVVPLRPSKKP